MLKRYDMKKILGDPVLRRWLITRSVVVTQAREGIEVTQEEAEQIYDNQLLEKNNDRNRNDC